RELLVAVQRGRELHLLGNRQRRLVQRLVAARLVDLRLLDATVLVDEEPDEGLAADARVAQERRVVALERARDFGAVAQLRPYRERRKARRCREVLVRRRRRQRRQVLDRVVLERRRGDRHVLVDH